MSERDPGPPERCANCGAAASGNSRCGHCDGALCTRCSVGEHVAAGHCPRAAVIALTDAEIWVDLKMWHEQRRAKLLGQFGIPRSAAQVRAEFGFED